MLINGASFFSLKTYLNNIIIILRYGDMMRKNKKGFTLVELLAVIVILGVIMTIAVPNIISTLDKNKKETFLKDAQNMISAAEYKIRSDTSIEYPDAYSVTIIKLANLDSVDLEVSPYDTYYSKELSFVAITLEQIPTTGEYERVYYAHLVSCSDMKCENTTDDSVAYNRGINLSKLGDLNTSDRFDLVVKGSTVEKDLINNIDEIKTKLHRETVNIY